METKQKQILKQTQEHYNIIACHFSEKRKFLWPELKPFLKYVKKGNRVLDIGCGNGRLYGELREYIRLQGRSGKQTNSCLGYLGVDFSQKLLNIARKKYPYAKFRKGDVTQEKTWQSLNNFDVCFCLAVLHHLPTPQLQLKVLKQINQSLKSNGILVLSVWNLWQKRYLVFHFQQLGWKIFSGLRLKWLKVPYKVSDGRKIIKRVNRFCYCFDLAELRKLMKKAGFKIIEEKRGKNFCLVGQK